MRIFLWVLAGVGLLAVGCTDREAGREKEAARMVVGARDLEEDLETLPKAVERYGEIAKRYAGTSAGQEAQTRHAQLQEAQRVLEELERVPEDSSVAIYQRAALVAPNYPPVLRRVGTAYFNNTALYARGAVSLDSPEIADSVLRLWARQDSLWSGYDFRPTVEDRTWRDRLCEQAVDVARMLEQFRRYEEALAVIDRGLSYASGEAVSAHARVFASFYTFRDGREQEAIDLAKDALAYEFLSQEDRARANHVTGLAYTYLHQDSGDTADLDSAIKALNEAVTIDPSMDEAKKLLKTLRVQRQKIVG